MLQLKPSMAVDAIVTLMNADVPVFLHGAPGVGKTSLIQQASARVNRQCLVSRLALMEPVDLYGIPFTHEGRVLQAKPDFFPKEGGPDATWFFDEWLQGSTATQNAAGQLVHEHRLGDYQLPSNVYVCAASNRAGDRAGTNRMPSHIADRFDHIEIVVDVNDWVKWALRAGLDTKTIAFIRFKPDYLQAFEPNKIVSPSPRSWEKVSQVATRGKPNRAIAPAVYAGLVGEGVAAEYIAFLDVAEHIPDPDECIRHPKAAPLPPAGKHRPAVTFALCGVLSRKTTGENFDRVIQYVERLDEEFAIACVKQSIDRDPNLTETRAFTEFVAHHQSAMS